MADPVSSLGSLSAGTLQALQAAPKSPPPAEKSRPPKADVSPKGQDGRPEDASAQNLDAASKTIQEYLQDSRSDMVFSVDQETGGPVFKIVDASTREVIRQLPSEEVLAMAHQLRKLARQTDPSGLLVDRQE